MSTRFDLNPGAKLHLVAQWLNENIGQIEEGKTWFWSTRDYKEVCSNTGQLVDKVREGVRIWQDSPKIMIAILKWGS